MKKISPEMDMMEINQFKLRRITYFYDKTKADTTFGNLDFHYDAGGKKEMILAIHLKSGVAKSTFTKEICLQKLTEKCSELLNDIYSQHEVIQSLFGIDPFKNCPPSITVSDQMLYLYLNPTLLSMNNYLFALTPLVATIPALQEDINMLAGIINFSKIHALPSLHKDVEMREKFWHCIQSMMSKINSLQLEDDSLPKNTP